MDRTAAGEEPLRSQHDIVLARQLVRRLSQELRFSLVDQTKMVTAASELARNTLIYGGGGAMHWNILNEGVQEGACGWCSAIRDRHPEHRTRPDRRLDLRRRVGAWTFRSAPAGQRLRYRILPRGTRVTIIRWS